MHSRAAPGHTPEVVPAEATGVVSLLAPQVVGLGLLEAVEDATLLALEDENDADGDGVSGRAQRLEPTTALADLMARDVALPAGTGVTVPYLGRFGRKASATTLLHQTLTAYVQDMGVTTPFQGVSLLAGSEVLDAGLEIDVNAIADVVIYLRTLKLPARRSSGDPVVLDGERLFDAIGCASCHVPTLTTGPSAIAALSGVSFSPYSDLLLHDIGPELDDGYTEGVAGSSEWRTTPLWGLGLAARSQGGHGYYLHDGRARSLDEAIDLHGGEGAAARARFLALAADARASVIAFLESL
jgi:CxxC motif-containing protein (DUF1111 family)